MDNVKNLLDKCKDLCQLQSDNQLAIKLKVTRASVSRWRNGLGQPDTVTCAKIAEITGLPLARVLGIVGEARAISAAEKAVWRKLAQAAIVLIAIAPAITVAAPMSILTDDINNASELPKFAEFLLCKKRRKKNRKNNDIRKRYQARNRSTQQHRRQHRANSKTLAVAQKPTTTRTTTTRCTTQSRRRMFASTYAKAPINRGFVLSGCRLH